MAQNGEIAEVGIFDIFEILGHNQCFTGNYWFPENCTNGPALMTKLSAKG
jgi:hypothetical protein